MPSESVHMEVSGKSLFYMKHSEDFYIEIGHKDMWTYADLTTNECSSDYL